MFYIDLAFKELYDEYVDRDEFTDVHVKFDDLFDKFNTAKKEAKNSAPLSSKVCITTSSMLALYWRSQHQSNGCT
jgi:hypothetical protein